MEATLAKSKVGRIYNFEYNQPYSGETRRHLARVVEIRRLTENDIARINSSSRYRSGDHQFMRTETIVTCQMPDGGYRNFYGERTDKCRCSVLASVMFWTGLARLFFRG